MRRRVGRIGVPRIETYLVEYQWRNIHKSNEELFLDLIKEINHFIVLNNPQIFPNLILVKIVKKIKILI